MWEVYWFIGLLIAGIAWISIWLYEFEKDFGGKNGK